MKKEGDKFFEELESCNQMESDESFKAQIGCLRPLQNLARNVALVRLNVTDEANVDDELKVIDSLTESISDEVKTILVNEMKDATMTVEKILMDRWSQTVDQKVSGLPELQRAVRKAESIRDNLFQAWKIFFAATESQPLNGPYRFLRVAIAEGREAIICDEELASKMKDPAFKALVEKAMCRL